LLTLANVRLGAWLGNPGPTGTKVYKADGPKFAVQPLVLEALGLTSETSKYVHLSDGGHFDNLGLYEAFGRRCRLIVVVDAGCDGKCDFEDLGGAIRLAELDFDLKVRFSPGQLGLIKDRKSVLATATIAYEDPHANGYLVYVKPGLIGNEPASVLSYAAKNPTFPHESTVDQWFGEGQFSAYVRLGEYVGKSISLPSDFELNSHELWA
jgi:hypothetical protein